MNLTPAQRRAVERIGQDVCITAGPGSGKTRVLVERFRWLMETQGVAPSQILTITFTEKAAYEIRRRLAKMFEQDAIVRAELERAPVATIHGFCTRLLKEHAVAAGLDPEFAILDERDADLLLRECIHDALNEYMAREPDKLRELYEQWDAFDPAQSVLTLYRQARMEDFAMPLPEGNAATIAQVLLIAHRLYSSAKQARSAVDFDDLEDFSIRLLESSRVLRSQIQLRYEHILMDEVQDTNPLQWRLVNLLRTPGCFFAVGDINQAIYGFREARPDGFLDYRRQVEAEGGAIDQLWENFRSRKEILDAAAAATKGMPGIEPAALDAKREFEPAAEPAVEKFVLTEKTADIVAEARRVAERILVLVGTFPVERDGVTSPARFADIALLFRTTGRFAVFAAEFQRAGIPYLLTGGRSLFERQEILDIVAWLRVLANPMDEVALAGVLRSPFAAIGPAELLVLREPGRNLWDSARISRIPSVRDVAAIIVSQRARIGDISPGALVPEALDATGYESGLDAVARANVRRVLEILDKRYESNAESPAALVRYLESLADRGESEAPPVNSPDAVRMMTMHAAKGLEFPIVFLPSLDLDARADPSSAYYSAGLGIGGKWRDADGEIAKDTIAEALSTKAREERAAESSRLLYVAMTRAEQKLILSAAKPTRGWTKRLALVKAPESPVAMAVSTQQPGWNSTELAVRRPAPTPQHDGSVSATSLTLFAHCPRRYFLDRYIGWESAPRVEGGTGGRRFGLDVHELLAGEDPDLFGRVAREAAEQFAATPMAEQIAQADFVSREMPFQIEVAGTIVSGQIDVWFRDRDGVTIADYKTDDLTAEEIAPAVETYSNQLRVYACALEQMTGETPNRAAILFLRSRIETDVDIARSRDRTEELVRRIRTAQDRQEFPLREGGHCKRCPHLAGACPAAGPQGQLELFG